MAGLIGRRALSCLPNAAAGTMRRRAPRCGSAELVDIVGNEPTVCRVVLLMGHAEPGKETRTGPGSLLNFGQQQRGALLLARRNKSGRCRARRRRGIGSGFDRQWIVT